MWLRVGTLDQPDLCPPDIHIFTASKQAWVQLPAGVPVVATPVANLPEIGDLISVATGADGFVEAIEAHLAAGRPRVDLDVLRPHSWSQRVEHVFELIDEAVAAPPPT